MAAAEICSGTTDFTLAAGSLELGTGPEREAGQK